MIKNFQIFLKEKINMGLIIRDVLGQNKKYPDIDFSKNIDPYGEEDWITVDEWKELKNRVNKGFVSDPRVKKDWEIENYFRFLFNNKEITKEEYEILKRDYFWVQ